MRQLIVLFSILGLVMYSSCNDENTSKNEDKLVGAWSLESQTRIDCNNSNDNGEVTFDCIQQDCDALIFYQDLRFERVTLDNNGVEFRESGTWRLVGDMIRFSYEDDGNTIIIEQKWQLSGNVLRIFETNELSGCEISSQYVKVTT